MDIFVGWAANKDERGRIPSWRRVMGKAPSCPDSVSRILEPRSMIPTLEQILGRVDDPETPVVWLDPAIPEDVWRSLPAGLTARGFHVFHIDEPGPVEDRESLLARFEDMMHLPERYMHDFDSLKDCLMGMAAEPSRGWAVLFSNPGPLRQADEAAFEELMEVLESVHESVFEIHMKSFKLVVRD